MPMEIRKRSSTTASIETTDQPSAKQKRHESPLDETLTRPSGTWRPRCVFMVEHTRKHRLQFHNRNAADGEKRNCGMFVSLADANFRVQDVMEDVVGEYWLSNERGEDSTFNKGGDEYYGNPGHDGEKVGSSWEFDDWQSDITHKVYVRAYPLAWPMQRGETGFHGGEALDQSEVIGARANSNEMEWVGV